MLNTREDQELLRAAISRYDFPRVAFDFRTGQEVPFSSMRGVEKFIRQQLTATNLTDVKDGLSNVLYWGHARVGYRRIRLEKFRSNVTLEQLAKVRQILTSPTAIAISLLKALHLPEFSGLSFLSKILMYVDPARYVVLDLKLASLRSAAPKNIFCTLKLPTKPTSIPVTPRAIGFYAGWCNLCRSMSSDLGDPSLRAVDIERGIFQLLGEGRVETAARLLSIKEHLQSPEVANESTNLVDRITSLVATMPPSRQKQVLDFIDGISFTPHSSHEG